MNTRDIRTFATGVVIGTASLYAMAAVSIPNTFTAGTPIKASEVNANFSSLKAGLDALETAKQSRVNAKCDPGSSIREVKIDGTVTCQTDQVGTGGNSYTAGMGLSLEATKFLVDTTVIQSRVTGVCDAGSSIREVKPDGSVTCQPDNAGATFGSAISGTSNNAALEINNTGGGVGLQAETSSAQIDVPGVLGINLATSGQVVGVIGQALNSPIGTGISGFGRITGGYFEAKSPASGGFTPTGVYGVALSSDGTGVKAWNKSGGTALEVDGGIRVTGANRAAFRVSTVGGALQHTVVIDSPYANNDFLALVTFAGIGGSTYSTKLNYDGTLNKWVIQCTGVDGGFCPNSYNVIVIKQN